MRLPAPPAVNVRQAFAPIGSEDREELNWFLRDIERLRRSTLARHLADMGSAPVVELSPHRDGGGSGVIRTRALHEEVRDASFPVLRKLRTDHARGSIRRTRRILAAAGRNVSSDEATQVREYLAELGRALRDANSGRAVLGFRVRAATGERAYTTNKEVLDWRQNAMTFHNAGRRGDRQPRRDYESFPEELIDPAVDGGLRLVAELGLGLGELVAAVLTDPALVQR